MNAPEMPLHDSSDNAQLKQQLSDLRRHATLMQLGLVILSLTFAGFVGLQARRAKNDLNALRPQATQIIDLNKKEAPQIQALVSQLEAYGRGHPEYAEKVLAKYGIKSGATNPAGTLPGAAPKP
jgi:hypothetical protein